MNNKEISMFDLLIETHIGLDRQGPGSSEMTIKALSFVENLDNNSRIADIGCGTGGQTMVLAQNTNSHITGIDMIADFVNIFNENANKSNFHDRVNGIVGDALELSFEKEELDLIWSEGMIDSLGFQKALSYWNGFLKKGGYVAVTSPSWLTSEHPAEIEKFWIDAGSGLHSIESNIESMRKSGFSFVAAFTLPDECWMQNYFIPRKMAEKNILQKYPDNDIVKEYIESMKYEVDLYEKYKQHYGYVFYIGKNQLS